MITPASAAKAAESFLRGLLGPQGQLLTGIRLEEIEHSKAKKRWWVTLSYAEESLLPSLRTYKRFAVDEESGEVLAMKIRVVA
jgi:hypothetical protein